MSPLAGPRSGEEGTLPSPQTLRPTARGGRAQGTRGLVLGPGSDKDKGLGTWILPLCSNQEGRLPDGCPQRGQELTMPATPRDQVGEMKAEA